MNYKQLMQLTKKNTGFINHVGLKVTDVGEGYAKGELELEPVHGNPIGSVHGGVLFTLSDNVAGIAATTRGYIVTTMNASIHYINPAIRSSILFAEAKEVKSGKRTAVYDVDITDDLGVHISTARFSFFHLKEYEDSFVE